MDQLILIQAILLKMGYQQISITEEVNSQYLVP